MRRRRRCEEGKENKSTKGTDMKQVEWEREKTQITVGRARREFCSKVQWFNGDWTEEWYGGVIKKKSFQVANMENREKELVQMSNSLKMGGAFSELFWFRKTVSQNLEMNFFEACANGEKWRGKEKKTNLPWVNTVLWLEDSETTEWREWISAFDYFVR